MENKMVGSRIFLFCSSTNHICTNCVPTFSTVNSPGVNSLQSRGSRASRGASSWTEAEKEQLTKALGELGTNASVFMNIFDHSRSFQYVFASPVNLACVTVLVFR